MLKAQTLKAKVLPLQHDKTGTYVALWQRVAHIYAHLYIHVYDHVYEAMTRDKVGQRIACVDRLSPAQYALYASSGLHIVALHAHGGTVTILALAESHCNPQASAP